MITAAKARENVMTYYNNHIDDILAKLSEEIERVSKNGESRIVCDEYNGKMLKMIIKACRRKGYTVTNCVYGCLISWE